MMLLRILGTIWFIFFTTEEIDNTLGSIGRGGFAVAVNSPPTRKPTKLPSLNPTKNPTVKTTSTPTLKPSSKPSFKPSLKPAIGSTINPSKVPSATPSIASILKTPTAKPTTVLSKTPSFRPTESNPPTLTPSTTQTIGSSIVSQCVDIYPYSDGYTCPQQAALGQCSQPWLQSPYCDFSCGRCGCLCNCPDYYPYTDGYTCQQQAGWGQCGQLWMQPPVCMHSCGRCGTGTNPTTAPVALPPASPTVPSQCSTNSTNQLLQHNGRPIFLSGVNVAWGPVAPFGQDINFLDPLCSSTTCVNNRAYFTTMFSTIAANGGNSLRFWLHPDGSSLPVVGGDYTARIIDVPTAAQLAGLRFVLQLGETYKVLVNFCLWSFDMVNDQGYGIQYGRWNKVLTNSIVRNSYLSNWLRPMVAAAIPFVSSSLLSWEVFNEPEGMTTKWGWTGCASGTSDCAKVDIVDIQRLANLVASNVHTVDSRMKVTVGSWSYQALSYVNGATNIWSDGSLQAAGGLANGVLDYYQVHFYNGFGNNWSPLQHPVAFWQALDKPHVIGELPNDPTPYSTNSYQSGSYFYEKLLQNCYGGSWGWVYCAECGGSSSFDKLPFLKNMLFIQSKYPALVTVSSGPSPPPSSAPSLGPVAPHPTFTSTRSPSVAPAKSTIVPSAGLCSDNYPYTDGYTCQQQAGWGKCGESWMQPPVCMKSCGRCT